MMAPYANVIIKCARKVLHSLMSPKRSQLLTCFVFIIFINLLTCHQTPNEISKPTPQPEDYEQSESQDQFDHQETSTIEPSVSTANLSQAVTKLLPQDVKSHFIGNIGETRNTNRTTGAVTDKPPDIRQGQSANNKLEDRVGRLAQGLHSTSSSSPKFQVKASPSSEHFRASTVSSLINDDDPVDDPATMLIETSSPSNDYVSRLTTELNASSNFDSSISAENQKSKSISVASAQDLDALEASSPHNYPALRAGTKLYKSSSALSETSNPSSLDILASRSSPSDQPVNAPSSQPESTSSLIPNASLMDLLHIIKHLNLMSGSDEQNSKNDPSHPNGLDHTNSSQLATAQTETRLADERNSWSQGAWHRRQALSDHLMPFPIRSMKFTANSVNATPEVLTALDSAVLGKVPSERSRTSSSAGVTETSRSITVEPTSSDATKRNTKFKSPHNSKRPLKHSLISPYSANFESGLDLLIKNTAHNRASKPSLMDQLEAHSLATTRPTVQDSEDGQKLKIGSKLRPDKSYNSKSSAFKFDYQTGAQAANEDKSMSRYTTKRPVNSQKTGQEPKTKSAVKTSISDDSISSDDTPKRGERDIINQTDKSNSEQDLPSTDIKSELGDKRQSDLAGELPPFRKQKKKEGPPYQIYSRPESSFEGSNPTLHAEKVEANIKDLITQQVPSSATSYLDDPHKKSYYWTSEQAGLYLDALGAQPHSSPLTIGQLAYQHGVTPLGFQSSSYFGGINPSFHETPSVSENFGLISESNLDGSFAKFPHNHHDDPLFGSQSDHNHLKIDDELKKAIAIKSIEAATKYPELSATLFGNMLNFNEDLGSAQQKLPSHISNLINSINSLSSEDSRITNFKPLASHDINPFKGVIPFSDATWPSESKHGMNSLMMPIQDTSLVPAASSGVNSTSAQPVDLVITDLANKWALSRMPDLVPIPLAATVPGYLIRLPDGKILAAALTNLFSIQGIQQGPLTSSYKNLINNKFKALIKQNHQSGKPGHHHGNVVADSGLRPTVVLPPGHYPYGIVTTRPKMNLKSNRNHDRDRAKTVGLLSRLNQLGFGGSRTNHRDQSRLFKQSTKGTRKPSGSKMTTNQNLGKSHLFKLPNSPFPASTLSDQELANLPVANPNEPVFSFADESQLNDHPRGVSPTLTRNNQLAMVHDFVHQAADRFPSNIDLHALASGTGPNLGNLHDKFRYLLKNSRNLPHLGTFGGLSGDDFLNYESKRRKSLTRPSFLTKLEAILKWLASKRAQLTRKDSRHCRDKV